jgi:dihydrofolate reductase
MARLINTTTMTIDGVIDVGDWFVAVGDHDDAARSLFETKYVASRSALGPLDWNATAIEGDAVEGVRKLKAEHAGDLVMSGCGELARELIQAGLVDELYFWIHPRIQGPGGRPYEAATVPVRLIEARQFDSGVTLLRYEPVQNR